MVVAHCCRFIHIYSTISARLSVLSSPTQPNPPSPVFLKRTSQFTWWIILSVDYCFGPFFVDTFLVIVVQIKTNNLIINDFAFEDLYSANFNI